MNRHTVFVAGKRFVLLSDDKKEYVQSLAQEVSSAINKISEENPALESRGCAILCALDYADDKYKEMEKNKSLSGSAKTVLQQADKHAKQLKELKETLAEKDNIILNLKEELEMLKTEINTSNNANSIDKSNSFKDDKAINKKDNKKKAKKHSHFHPNPYKDNQAKKSEEAKENPDKANKGYTPVRQYSLFENEEN